MTIRSALAQRAADIQTAIDSCLTGPSPIRAPMSYAMRGGKALRGFLAIESAAVCGVDADRVIWAAAAIEAMHAYSLVHDDLPCMDDDDLRRGQPTVHRKWDEATAVLTGDALQAAAFEFLSMADADPAVALGLVRSLAVAAGYVGMVRGQALDLAAETAPAPLTLDQITELQQDKTGALIEWACLVGPRVAQTDAEPMRQYARAIGLAFQIADDILDIEGDTDAVGKRLRKDAAAGKATFVSLMGLEQAKVRAASLIDDACRALDPYGARGDILRQTAEFVIARRN